MATPLASIHLDEAASTQDEARQRFSGQPLLVTASRQTTGRGRSGASWENADRAVAASVAFTPSWPERSWPLIAAVTGLAALDVMGDRPALKWPNDVLLDGRKVAGILVESSGWLVVAGIGINLWWPEPVAGAGALHAVDPGPDEGPRMAEAWAQRLLTRMTAGPGAWGRAEYEARSATIGADVTWDSGGWGRAVGIAEEGGLIVDTEAGRIVLDSGAVRLVRAIGDGAGPG